MVSCCHVFDVTKFCSLNSQLPRHRRQQLFLSGQFCYSQACIPLILVPRSSVAAHSYPVCYQHWLACQPQMSARCTFLSSCFYSCILNPLGAVGSLISQPLSPAERLMQLSFPSAVELFCFLPLSLDCTRLLSLTLSFFFETALCNVVASVWFLDPNSDKGRTGCFLSHCEPESSSHTLLVWTGGLVESLSW